MSMQKVDLYRARDAKFSVADLSGIAKLQILTMRENGARYLFSYNSKQSCVPNFYYKY